MRTIGSGPQRRRQQTSRRHDPARLHRTPSVAWLMALAFTSRRRDAVIAYPALLIGLWPPMVRGGLYETTDNHGAFVLVRRRPALDVAIALTPAVVILWATPSAMRTAFNWSPTAALLIVVGLAVLLCWLLLGSVATRTSWGGSAVGPETPRGSRWYAGALAQRPGTSWSALALARQLLSDLPAGELVVATAGDDRLLAAYQRAGFTRGQQRRIWRRTT